MHYKVYLLDLRTGEKRQVPNEPLLLERRGVVFLNSELVWLRGSLVGPGNNNYRPHYVLDLTNGQKYELVDLKWDFDTVLDNGDLNPDLFPYFTEAEQVFVSYEYNATIALAPNFHQNPKRNIYFNQSSFGQGARPENGELLVKLLNDLQVDYKIIDFSIRYVDQISPTGKYVIRDFGSRDGIYYAGTDTPLILVTIRNDILGAFAGWYYDERSIVLALGRYFYSTGNPWGRSFSFPGPILKFNLPVP